MSAPAGISVREFARREGCDEKLVRRKIQQGALLCNADGTVDPTLVGTGWRRTNRHAKPADTVPQVSALSAPGLESSALSALANDIMLSMADAEKRKVNFEGLLKQLKYDREAGLVVLISEVAEVVASEYARVRTRLLAIPAEQAPQIHRLKSVQEVQDWLHRCIHEALEELTQDGDASAN